MPHPPLCLSLAAPAVMRLAVPGAGSVKEAARQIRPRKRLAKSSPSEPKSREKPKAVDRGASVPQAP